MTITQESGALVARSQHGTFLAAVSAPANKRYLAAARKDLEQLARYEQQRQGLSHTQR